MLLGKINKNTLVPSGRNGGVFVYAEDRLGGVRVTNDGIAPVRFRTFFSCHPCNRHTCVFSRICRRMGSGFCITSLRKAS